MKAKGIKLTFISIVMMILVVSYYYHISNKTSEGKDESEVKSTSYQEVILKNYKINYPPTPKEVVKEHLYITKVMHNEKLTDNQIVEIADKITELYDNDLVANKSKEDYIKDLKSELATFRDNDYAIVNYFTSSSTDVEEYKMDGDQFAKLYATISIRVGKGTENLQEIYVLRKDDSGHWKIYGWQPIMEDEDE